MSEYSNQLTRIIAYIISVIYFLWIIGIVTSITVPMIIWPDSENPVISAAFGIIGIIEITFFVWYNKIKFIVYIEDYDFDSLMEKNMLPLVPFYPMRYEKMLKRKHSEQEEKEMLTDLVNCYEKLKKAVLGKIIGGSYYQYMSMSMSNVLKGMIERMKQQGHVYSEEEAKKVMQKMIDEPMEIIDIFGALKESREEGREEGREQERLETVLNMLADKVPDEEIIKYTRITADELEGLKKELWWEYRIQ